MPAWFAIAAPYIPEIIKIARPLFTRNNPKEKSIEVVGQQIAELQTAAIQNAESIKLLATEMQHTIEALQKASTELEKKLDRARVLLIISVTTSVLAFCVAIYSFAR
jgi:ABC-type hemin transport system substrate-binding protein